MKKRIKLLDTLLTLAIMVMMALVSVSCSKDSDSPEPDLKPDKIFAKQTSTPGLAAGRGKTGVNAGPFIKIKENRFADVYSCIGN